MIWYYFWENIICSDHCIHPVLA